MSALGAALREHASRTPDRTALADHQQVLNYRDLAARIRVVSERLNDVRIRCLGLLADNGLPWVLVDLAAHIDGIPVVPLPLFFSPRQICHALDDSGVDAILTDQPDAIQAMLAQAGFTRHVSDPNRVTDRAAADSTWSTLADSADGHGQGDLHLGHDRRTQGRMPESSAHGDRGAIPGRGHRCACRRPPSLPDAVVDPARESWRRACAAVCRSDLPCAAAGAGGTERGQWFAGVAHAAGADRYRGHQRDPRPADAVRPADRDRARCARADRTALSLPWVARRCRRACWNARWRQGCRYSKDMACPNARPW